MPLASCSYVSEDYGAIGANGACFEPTGAEAEIEFRDGTLDGAGKEGRKFQYTDVVLY